MIPTLMFSLAAHPQGGGVPIVRLAVVTEAPLSADLRAEMEAKPLAEELAAFVKRGYGRSDQNGVALLFSPRLWAEKELVDMPRLWHETAKAVAADGTVDLSQAPTLTQQLSTMYGAMGYTGVEKASLLLDSMPSITMVANGVSKTFTLGNGLDGGRRRSLQARKLGPQDPKVAQKLPPARWLGQIIAPDGICVFTPGPKSLDPILRTKDVANAAKLLAERYEKAAEETRQARREVGDRFPSLDPLGSVRPGDGLSEMSDSLRLQLQDLVAHDYKRLGFSSLEAANGWLAGARVGSAKANYLVTAAVDDGVPGPAYRSVGLP